MMNLDQKTGQLLDRLRAIAREHQPVAFASSLGLEDMVVTDLIARHALSIEVFTLDTGRLPKETYDLMQQVKRRYPALALKIYFPDAAAVEGYVNAHGINGFYDSVDLRKSCCHVRKVEPLNRALAGKAAWVTGLRQGQAQTRESLPLVEDDLARGIKKYNPLGDWSLDEVWAYVRAHEVPYNALHDQHYPSIGCAPCTRSISVGEDVRAGRWWWENPESKECGLHVQPISILKQA